MENKEPGEIDFTLPPDDTVEQFPKIREIVLKYVPLICSGTVIGYRKGKQAERIHTFINKYLLPVTKDAVIAIVDTSILNNGKSGLLFTTNAIYYKKILEKVVRIAYRDIDYALCTLQHDKKGKPYKLNISCNNGDIKSISDTYMNLEPLLDMLGHLGKLSEFAATDSPQSVAEMDYSVKLPFVKAMVNFMTCCKQPHIELMRFACDIGFTDEQLSELVRYIAGPKEPDTDILLQLYRKTPYPSGKSLKYALLTDMLSQLQFAKHSSEVSMVEHEFIDKISKIYGFSEEDITNIKVIAQTKYKILTGGIKSVNKLKKQRKAIIDLSSADDISLITVVGSSFIFWKSLWVLFIPGIGAMLGSAVYGAGITSAIIKKIKNNKKMNKQKFEMMTDEIKSYLVAIDRLLRLFPGMGDEITLLKKHCETLMSKNM